MPEANVDFAEDRVGGGNASQKYKFRRTRRGRGEPRVERRFVEPNPWLRWALSHRPRALQREIRSQHPFSRRRAARVSSGTTRAPEEPVPKPASRTASIARARQRAAVAGINAQQAHEDERPKLRVRSIGDFPIGFAQGACDLSIAQIKLYAIQPIVDPDCPAAVAGIGRLPEDVAVRAPRASATARQSPATVVLLGPRSRPHDEAGPSGPRDSSAPPRRVRRDRAKQPLPRLGPHRS